MNGASVDLIQTILILPVLPYFSFPHLPHTYPLSYLQLSCLFCLIVQVNSTLTDVLITDGLNWRLVDSCDAKLIAAQ